MTNKEYNDQLALLSPTMRQYVEACIKDAELLEYLDAHGVHTWAYYQDALQEYTTDREH